MEQRIEVTIQSILPSGEPQGRFCLKISPNETVATLLSDLSKEAGVQLKDEYCLRSKSNDLLVRTRTLTDSGIQDGAFLHWTMEDDIDVNVKPQNSCNVFVVIGLISLLIGVGGIITICIVYFEVQDPIQDYAITFDAGSTHTSMFIYKWEGSKYHGTALASQVGEKCTAKGKGISSFVKHPNDAGKSLEECLKVAEDLIPSDKHYGTPIYLGATAGMRLLNETDPLATEIILVSIRETFQQYPFELLDPKKSVRILSGADEGSFSWITNNYISNAFGVDRPNTTEMLAPTIVPTVGALDMGGASAQITFIPKKGTVMPQEASKKLVLFGKKYTVYTHSYLCYGVMEMLNRVSAALIQANSDSTDITNPCLPKDFNITQSTEDIYDACVSGKAGRDSFGYSLSPPKDWDKAQNITFYGASDGEKCRSLLNEALFDFDKCNYTQCSFNGVYQPDIHGPFYAFSTYNYVTSFLNLTSSNSSSFPHSDMLATINRVCAMDWEQLQQIPVSSQQLEALPWYCQEAIYIDLILSSGYNFTDKLWPELHFVSKLSNTEVGWSLGFVLSESLLYPVDKPPVKMYPWTYGLLMALFVLFMVVAAGLVLSTRRARRSQHSRYKRLSNYGTI